MTTLPNRCAIITGANQGLGRAIAEEFLRAGANVVLCARNKEMLQAAQRELTNIAENERQISIVDADVSKVEQVERLVDHALSQYGKVDILVNNAGVYGPKGLIEDVDWDDWIYTIEVNLYGPMLLCRALLPHFKANRYGKIINLSGGGATAPLPRLSAYAAAKAALVRLTETIAHETLGCGIDVNSVAPGALNTRMLEEVLQAGPTKVGQEFFDRAVKQSKEGGASLQRAAQLCVFLASEESNGITGRLLSAVWDPWEDLPKYVSKLKCSEIYTLRRIVPADRGENWENH